MKIRTALTWKNTLVTATVFLLCMVLIYLVSEHTRSRTFFHDLKSEAITKAHLFLQNQVDAKTMQSIYLNNRKFINEVEVAVYTPDFQMLYHDAIQNDIIQENREMIDRILQEKEIEFNVDKYQGIGILYILNGKEYIVTAAAYDGYGYQNLLELQKTLGILFIIGLSLLFVTGYFLARASLKPIRDIVRKAETITASRWVSSVQLLMPCWTAWKYPLIHSGCLSAMLLTNYVLLWLLSLRNWTWHYKRNGPRNSIGILSDMRWKMPGE